MGDPLTGHAILIVEPGIDQFVTKLQAALEHRGAETLAVREPARPLDRVREFCLSAFVVTYDHAFDALHTPIDNLGDMPLVLYGHDSASALWSRSVPRLVFTRASVESIMIALDRLPPAVRH
jgi:hypothetical protein